MLKGKVQMGNAHQTQLRWDQDTLDDCSPEDQVWGWSIRSSEVLHQDCTKFDDEVLHKMLYQGLLDKKAGALAWTDGTSVKQGDHFVSSMVVRVLQRCFRMDDKVRHSGCLFFVAAPDWRIDSAYRDRPYHTGGEGPWKWVGTCQEH